MLELLRTLLGAPVADPVGEPTEPSPPHHHEPVPPDLGLARAAEQARLHDQWLADVAASEAARQATEAAAHVRLDP